MTLNESVKLEQKMIIGSHLGFKMLLQKIDALVQSFFKIFWKYKKTIEVRWGWNVKSLPQTALRVQSFISVCFNIHFCSYLTN